MTELQSGSVDGRRRSVPTNVGPLAKRRKLTEEVATDSNVYDQTQMVSINLAEYQEHTVSHSRVHLYYYCSALPSTAHVVYASLLAGHDEYQGLGLGLSLSTNVNCHPSNVFHVACVLCI